MTAIAAPVIIIAIASIVALASVIVVRGLILFACVAACIVFGDD